MKQRMIVIALASVMAISMLALSACGGGQSSSSSASSSSSSEASSSAASSSSTEASQSTDSTSSSSSSSVSTTSSLTESDVRASFQQMTMNMVDFYSGSSEAGEQVYYAGGASGQNAILVFIEPSSMQAASFIGPVTTGNDNRITISDSSTQSTITFAVTGNSDSTVTFDLGNNYGTATLSPCTSDDVVEALTQLSMIALQAENEAAQTSSSASAESTASQGN